MIKSCNTCSFTLQILRCYSLGMSSNPSLNIYWFQWLYILPPPNKRLANYDVAKTLQARLGSRRKRTAAQHRSCNRPNPPPQATRHISKYSRKIAIHPRIYYIAYIYNLDNHIPNLQSNMRWFNGKIDPEQQPCAPKSEPLCSIKTWTLNGRIK